MKYEYTIYTFKISDVQETEDWINRKGKNGFKITNIHYHDIDKEEYVRITLEKGE